MVVIQNIINDSNVDEENLSQVCQDFLNENALEESELLIRLVSPVEIQVLNKEYRDKNQVTNVLSFQSDKKEKNGGFCRDLPRNLFNSCLISFSFGR